MAKKDRFQNDEKTDEIDTAPEAEVEAEEAPAAPDLTGLVKMKKDAQVIHAHPDIVKHHKENGWQLV